MTIAKSIPTMNMAGVIPIKDVATIITVMVRAPVVPAYPGSAQSLLPIYTNVAAINPPSGVPME